MHRSQTRNESGGYTLIELLIVIAIIATIVGFVLPQLQDAREKGIDAAIRSTYANLRAEAALFRSHSVSDDFDGFCASSANPDVTKFLEAGASRSPHSYTTDADSDGEPEATCNTNTDKTDWAASVELNESGPGGDPVYWCVDSNGFNGETVEEAANGSCA